MKDGIVGRENLHLAVLVGDPRVAERPRETARTASTMLAAVVLNDHRAARRRVVENALVVGAQIVRGCRTRARR